MVVSFFVVSSLPGPIEVLFSRHFYALETFEIVEGKNKKNCCGDILQKRLNFEELVGERVRSEQEFHVSVGSRSSWGQLSKSSDIHISEDLEKGGILSFKIAGVNSEKCLIWHSMYKLIYILVCEKHENSLLASKIMQLMISSFQDYLPIFSQPEEIQRKCDIICTIVDAYLPNGQLRFMHHGVIHQVEKALHKALTNVT